MTVHNDWIRNLLAAVCVAGLLSGCATTVSDSVDGDGPPVVSPSSQSLPPDAVPKAEPPSRYGNPKSYVVFGKRYYTMSSADGFTQRGEASWYGKKFHGRKTSSGEVYDMYAMTAAHKNLPLPTYVRVTNLNNGRSTVVKVNDRGPFHGNRIIDLSYSAARKLDMVRAGVAPVEVVALLPGASASSAPVAPVSAPTGGEHYVQAGAVVSADNADLRLAEVRSLVSAPASTLARLRSSVKYHVVWVGPFASLNIAEDMTRQLRNAGIVGVHIVKDR